MARKTRLGDNLGVRLPERIMLPPAHKAIEAAAFDRLVSRGLLAREDFDAALKESFSGKKELESILLTKYRLSKAQLGQALSEFFDCPYVPYDDRTVVDVELVKNLSFDYLRRNFWIPLRRQGPLLDILIDDPHNLDKGLDIRRAFPGLTIRYSVSLRQEIEQFILAAMGQTESGSITEILGELVNEATDTGPDDSGAAAIDVRANSLALRETLGAIRSGRLLHHTLSRGCADGDIAEKARNALSGRLTGLSDLSAR